MPHRKVVIHALVCVYLASGLCSLMDEVVWFRLLKLIIGNTVYASSIVVSVFLGGLAIGAAIMGKLGHRFRRPLRAYAMIELAITTTVLMSPIALRQVDAFYVWLWRSFHPDSGALIVWQAVVSGLILLVPTILMGSTLPLLARFITSLEKEAGPLVGRLYALNTLGAAAGTFLAGFVLIPSIGVMWTLRTSAILNVVVACGGYLLHRVSYKRNLLVGSVQTQMSVTKASRSHSGLKLLACGFFLSGLACIGYELMWMRSVVHSVGNFTYVFSAVLTVYLVGNVIGTMIGSRVVKSLKNPALAYCAMLFMLGIAGIAYLPWLHLCNYHLLPWISSQPEMSLLTGMVPLRIVKPLIQCTILLLVPSIVMGIGFPLMIQAWVDRVGCVGVSTGLAYSVNTLGAVAGGLLTGFVLIPLLGLQSSITILGLIVVWFASVMWLVYVSPAPRTWATRFILPIASVFITLWIGYIPRDLFVKSVALSGYKFGHEIVAMKEGLNTTVSIHRNPKYGSLYLYTSGCIVAGTSREFRADQKMLGHFPVLLNRHTERTLSVGFGSGESTACLAMHDLERIDCAEIAPEVVRCSLQHFAGFNLGDDLDDHVNMIYMDARNYLHLSRQTYDVIIGDCTGMSRVADNGSLFTKDYFECAREHLNEHGLFMSWIDTYRTESRDVVNSVLGTMMEVFPHVTLWYMTTEPSPFFVVVGSNQPQKFSIQHIAAELYKPAVAKSLSKVNIHSIADVLSCYIADQNDIRRYVRQFTCNTDDSPFIEFCTVENPAGRSTLREFFQTVRSDSVHSHLDWTSIDHLRKQQWLGQFEKVRDVAACIQSLQTATRYEERLSYCMKGLKIIPDYPALLIARRSIEKNLLQAGLKYLAQGNSSHAVSNARIIQEHDPNCSAAWILMSQVNCNRGETKLAIEAARRAVQMAPRDMSAYHNLWSILLSAEDPQRARSTLERAVQVFEADNHLEASFAEQQGL